MAVGFPLSSPLRVVGLAGLFDTISWGSYGGTPQITLEDLGPEYMFLYQPRPDRLELKKKVQWNNIQPTHRFQLHTSTSTGTAWEYPGLYEIYFDDTVSLQDSFYVGATYLNFKIDSVTRRAVKNALIQISSNNAGHHVYPSRAIFRFLDFPNPYNDTNWRYSQDVYILIPVFPIIDTTGMSADTTSISPVADQFTYLLPNPATDHATVYSSFPILNVAVFDPAGRCVLRRRVNDRTCHLDLTDYPKGIYLVTLTTPAGRTTKRLVVQ